MAIISSDMMQKVEICKEYAREEINAALSDPEVAQYRNELEGRLTDLCLVRGYAGVRVGEIPASIPFPLVDIPVRAYAVYSSALTESSRAISELIEGGPGAPNKRAQLIQYAERISKIGARCAHLHVALKSARFHTDLKADKFE